MKGPPHDAQHRVGTRVMDMLTPQEVSEHAFAKASFGGYNMAMVDEFLDTLTVDYTALYKENATLKAKMKVLVEKVEDYRSTEDAMRKALLTAQKMADDLVADAENQKKAMLHTAEEDARIRTTELRQELDGEQMRLTAAQNATAVYIAKLKELHQHEADYLSRLSELAPAVPTSKPIDPVNTAARDIEASMDRMLEHTSEESFPTIEPVRAGGLYAELLDLKRADPSSEVSVAFHQGTEDENTEDEDDTQPTVRINLENLQFGKDYQIE